MSIDIRLLAAPEEVNAGFRVFLRAMVGLPLRDVDAVELTEPGRFLGVIDGTNIVGGADSYTSWLTVPGGARVPHAAVTHVGVLPTHRRRGLLRRLITRQLQDIADRGEVVASLRASEAVIYERFGYGVASSAQSARVRLGRAELRAELAARQQSAGDAGPSVGGEVRLVDGGVTTELLAAIYDRTAWTGAIHRPRGWWRLQQITREADAAPHYVVVHRSQGVDDGYAIYRPENTDPWFTSTEKTVTVLDFVATSEAARVGLWRHLLSLDLVNVVAFGSLPLDDPLPLAVRDRRAVELGPARDETWLRLIDVEAALRARTYADADPVRLEVIDALLPHNAGVFEIGPKTVTRTSEEPHLSVDVSTLAAAYLGGTRWRHLATAGRVQVRAPAAVAHLDELFAVDALPHSGTSF